MNHFPKKIRMAALSRPVLLILCFLLVLTGCMRRPEKDDDPQPQITDSAGEEEIKDEKEYSFPYSYTTEEILCRNGDKRIFGIACIPETGKEKMPLVIFSHGLGGTHKAGIPYAERLAKAGYAVYIFDFCAGAPGTGSQSDGSDLEMSVQTEICDLESVLSAAENWSFADTDKIILMGISQGGTVSALTAVRHQDKTAGLILLNPAFNIFDMIHERFENRESIPEEFDIFNGWFHVSRQYAEDIWDTDPYQELSEYNGKVLLLHGEKDSVVDISYSVRAEQVLSNCEYHEIPDSDHEFYNESFEYVMDLVLNYLNRIENE